MQLLFLPFSLFLTVSLPPSRSIKFFDDRGPWSDRKGNLAVFESSNISETKKATPTKIGVHACDINPYLHEYFEPIPID